MKITGTAGAIAGGAFRCALEAGSVGMGCALRFPVLVNPFLSPETLMKLRYVPTDEPAPQAGNPPGFWTTGAIAAALEVPSHRVAYAIRTRRIPHAGRAGRMRLYDRDGVRQIADALRVTGAWASGSTQNGGGR